MSVPNNLGPTVLEGGQTAVSRTIVSLASASVSDGSSSDFAQASDALRSARPLRNPRLREAQAALFDGNTDHAQHLLSKFLDKHPNDVDAAYLMAETNLRLNQFDLAEGLLQQCVERAPDFDAARFTYANTLLQLNKPESAIAQVDALLGKFPRHILYGDLKAFVLRQMGRHEESMACQQQLAGDYPCAPEVWLNYGNALRSVGRREECIEAIRKAIDLRPTFGDAWLALANLKTFRFTASEVAAVNALLARSDLSDEDRACLHFVAGRAHGDEKRYASSFEHYAKANALRRLAVEYDPDSITRHVADSKVLFTPSFLRERVRAACPDEGPIFIVGMQRAGSTLVEQILASHSDVEPTAELQDISLLAQHICDRIAPEFASRYPRVLANLDSAAFKAFGERYLESTRFRRKKGRPFFTDKMPYNFLHLGLIRLILPNAKIVDVRRHPLACCFSNFATNFKFGALFTHRLSELGRTYAEYVELMAHFDSVEPGFVHRVFYESLVRDPEREIRRLLDHLGLPFQEACLLFHANRRAMDSVSSEQVRMPIFEDALEQWRHYESWLGPLKAALGPVLDAYPDVPPFVS